MLRDLLKLPRRNKTLAHNTLTLEGLTSYFNKNSIDPRSCAHLCIDVQGMFAHPRRTARHIAYNLTPSFRAAGIPNYWIRLETITSIATAETAFKYVTPADDEAVISKEDTSAFKGTNLHRRLKQGGIKTVILTGFDFNACVKDTALDAVSRYNTIILTDGTNFQAERNGTKATLLKAGIAFTPSKNLFKALRY